MNLTALQAASRAYTKTNSTNYPDATLNQDVNIVYGELWMSILEAEGYKNIAGDFKVYDLISTSGLSAGSIGYNGEYPFPASALDIEEAEISYDGVKWTPAEIIDRRNYSSSEFDESEINATYSQSSPKIWIYRNSYFVRPLKDTTGDITDGIKLSVQKRQLALTTGTDTPEFESNFHDLIPLRVAKKFYRLHPEKYNKLVVEDGDMLEAQMRSYYQDRIQVVRRFKTIKEQF